SVSRYVFKLPDLGEGTVEAEIVGWRVKPGDVVAEEDVIVEVMTDKAAVEVPAPVAGRVLSTTGAPGGRVPVGGEVIGFETDVNAAAAAPPPPPAEKKPAPAPVREIAKATEPTPPPESKPEVPVVARVAAKSNGASNGHVHVERSNRIATSPAIRRR